MRKVARKIRATAKLIENLRIVVDNRRAHSVCIDLPPKNGTNMGPTALELAVMSYAGCFATIFALTAQKMRIPIEALEVKLDALKSEEARTITEATFDILVSADAPKDRIHRIFKLTVKNCPVGKIFEKAGVKISYNLDIEKK